MDKVNQFGKDLNKIAKETRRALDKQSAEIPTTETVRDIFDSIVGYRAHFKVPRKGMSVSVNLQFELPPPIIGAGACCGDCFCTACDTYTAETLTDYAAVNTDYPYLSGTLRVFDSTKYDANVIELDSTTGLFSLGYLPDTVTNNTIYICYIYKYDSNCTTNPTIPTEVPNYAQVMAQII